MPSLPSVPVPELSRSDFPVCVATTGAVSTGSSCMCCNNQSCRDRILLCVLQQSIPCQANERSTPSSLPAGNSLSNLSLCIPKSTLFQLETISQSAHRPHWEQFRTILPTVTLPTRQSNKRLTVISTNSRPVHLANARARSTLY